MTRPALTLAAALLPYVASAQPTMHSYAVVGSYTVNNSSLAQTDPHVSGDHVAYTNALPAGTEIRVHSLSAASDVAIPNGGNVDSLSDISGDRIVFTRNSGSAQAIYVYEISSQLAWEVDPVWYPWRDSAAISGDTVAWVDSTLNWDPLATQIVAYDLVSQSVTQLVFDSLRHKESAIAPGGGTIVWTRCDTNDTNCDILRAERDATGAWVASVLPGSGEEARPATDGTIVVYESVRTNAAGALDRDIYFQPLSGGMETQVPLTDGVQQNASVAGGLIAFESRPDGLTTNFDIFLYDTATGFFYQLTSTTADERLTDIDQDPATGIVTVAYVKTEADDNVYAFRFSLTAPPPPPPEDPPTEEPPTGGCGDDVDGDDGVEPTCANPGNLIEVATMTLTRTSGQPDVGNLLFAAKEGDGLLCVTNSVPTGMPSTSGSVVLNGEEEVTQSDFLHRSALMAREVELGENNKLVAAIAGERGSSFTVTVYGRAECGTASMVASAPLQQATFEKGSLKLLKGTVPQAPIQGGMGCSSSSGGASVLAALLALSALALRRRRVQPDGAAPSRRH